MYVRGETSYEMRKVASLKDGHLQWLPGRRIPSFVGTKLALVSLRNESDGYFKLTILIP